MGANSKIEWTHHSWNAWVGCQKVSAACDHCYAEAWAKRAGRSSLWSGERARTALANWRQPYKWNEAARAAGERHRVFVNSLSDFWDNQVPPEWRADAFKVMGDCPWLEWLLLTKRPQNIAKLLKPALGPVGWPWATVWLGTTVENQEEADRRIPHLLAVPAVVHFLSMEPLLQYVDISRWTSDPASYLRYCDTVGGPRPSSVQMISMAIIGGESGAADRRPFRTEWALDIIGRCKTAGVAPFVKQLGSHVIHEGKRLVLKDKKGGDISEWPEELRVREFPKVPLTA